MMTDYRGARGHPRGGVIRGTGRPVAEAHAVTSPSFVLPASTTPPCSVAATVTDTSHNDGQKYFNASTCGASDVTKRRSDAGCSSPRNGTRQSKR